MGIRWVDRGFEQGIIALDADAGHPWMRCGVLGGEDDAVIPRAP
jgi:hypothetical protein